MREHPTSGEVFYFAKRQILPLLKPLHKLLNAEAATESYCECLYLALRKLGKPLAAPTKRGSGAKDASAAKQLAVPGYGALPLVPISVGF
jgi:hypothetical protein